MMLNQPTLDKLQSLKLHGMADAFRAQLETAQSSSLSFEERFAMLVDQQWLWKENRALARRLRSARLKEKGVVEDIDYQHPRGLDRRLIRTLATSDWVRQHQHILVVRSDRDWKNLVSLRLGAKSVSGRLHDFA
jgi:IstB-like ATP binding protein